MNKISVLAKLEGFAVSTFNLCGVSFVCTDVNLGKCAVVFVLTVMLAGSNSTSYRFVGCTIHIYQPLFRYYDARVINYYSRAWFIGRLFWCRIYNFK